MTVYFIGAGPGAPDLITLRGRDLIARAPVVLYAGSLVPPAVVASAPAGARVIDTATLTLHDLIRAIEAEQEAEIGRASCRERIGSSTSYPVDTRPLTQYKI